MDSVLKPIIGCGVCKKLVDSKLFFQLQSHKLICSGQIGRGDNLELQPIPFETGFEPWNLENETDLKLMDIYNENKYFILKRHSTLSLIKLYNFPVESLEKMIRNISQYLADIFLEQNHSFKVSVSVGYILKDDKDNLRYYIAHKNVNILNKPILISKHSNLRRLVNKLKNFDFINHIRLQRPTTKWRVRLITNLNMFIYPTDYPLGGEITLPDFLSRDRNIITLTKNKGGLPYKDNLCIFRCLSRLLHGNHKPFNVYKLYKQWNFYTGGKLPQKAKLFNGMDLNLLFDFESCFKLNCNIFEKSIQGSSLTRYISLNRFDRELNMNLYENHLSLIVNLDFYNTKFECSTCHRLFKRSTNLKRHKLCCYNKTRIILQNGLYSLPQTIFEKLEKLSISIPVDQRFFEYFVAYDLESALLKVPHSEKDSKLIWTQRHKCISAAFCSNVPGFTEPFCIVEQNEDKLLEQMIDYLYEIQKKSTHILRLKWGYIFEALDNLKNKYSEPVNKIMFTHICKIDSEFDLYVNQLICLGLNSSFYDLSILKANLAKHLNLDTDKNSFTIKKSNKYLAVSNSKLKFLDISNYMSPGVSYENFLKCFNISSKKSFFPYDKVDSFDVLMENKFPSYDSFYSDLKGYNVLEREIIEWERTDMTGLKPKEGIDNYNDLKLLWDQKGMKSLECLLRHYSYYDVKPLRDGILKMLEFYKERNLDLFKIAVSGPGVSKFMLHNSTDKRIPLIQRGDLDLYMSIRKNLTGGPAIVFNRYLSRDTLINGEPLASVTGFDCNSMYLWAMSKDMPINLYVRRRSPSFYPEYNTKYLDMFVWMDFLQAKTGFKIFHKMNNSNSEVRAGPYLLDGYSPDSNTSYDFLGCFFHGHSCYLTKNVKNVDLQKQRYKQTIERLNCLQSLGYKIETIWECEFKRDIKVKAQNLVYNYLPKFSSKNKNKLNESQIISAIMHDQLFCAIEVDIGIPEKWVGSFKQKQNPKQFFSDFPPIFCNTEIPYNCIGDVMQKYIVKNNLSKKPRRSLVSGLSAEKIFITSELLKWYISHGLVITKIYQFVDFTPAKCFLGFVETITSARRLADTDKSKSILANTFKLLGNSSYGNSILNRAKFTKIDYTTGKKGLSEAVNDTRFASACELNESLFEIESYPRKIKIDTPIFMGFFILNLAKLRLLEFYYDFINIYLPMPRHIIAETDTDSLYLGLPALTLEESINDERLKYRFKLLTTGQCGLISDPMIKDSFLKDKHGNLVVTDLLVNNQNFVCRTCHPECNARDSRTPGLWKREFADGVCMVSLSSKSYFLKSDKEEKISCKGLMKKNLKNPFEKFSSALFKQIIHSSVNRGFAARDNTIYTYTQERAGITFLYIKRKVLADYISTEPLDLVLCPWENRNNYIIIDTNDILSINHFNFFIFEKNRFHSVKQCLDYQKALFCNNKLQASDILNCEIDSSDSVVKVSENYKWFDSRDNILELIIRSKLESNKLFRDALLKTNSSKLVAIIEKDNYLGCGLTSDLVNVFDNKEFPGCNVWGSMLEDLRNIL